MEFKACFGRRQTVEIGDVSLSIIHVDDFKVNKRAAGRLQDLADLESLEDKPES